MEIMVGCAESRGQIPKRISIERVLVPFALPIIKTVIVIWVVNMKL